MLARGLVRAGGEVLVAATSAAASGDDDGFIRVGKVVDEFAGLIVVKQCADRDFERGGFAGVSGAVGAEAVTAALRLMLGVEAEVDEGVVARARRT